MKSEFDENISYKGLKWGLETEKKAKLARVPAQMIAIQGHTLKSIMNSILCTWSLKKNQKQNLFTFKWKKAERIHNGMQSDWNNNKSTN